MLMHIECILFKTSVGQTVDETISYNGGNDAAYSDVFYFIIDDDDVVGRGDEYWVVALEVVQVVELAKAVTLKE